MTRHGDVGPTTRRYDVVRWRAGVIPCCPPPSVVSDFRLEATSAWRVEVRSRRIAGHVVTISFGHITVVLCDFVGQTVWRRRSVVVLLSSGDPGARWLRLWLGGVCRVVVVSTLERRSRGVVLSSDLCDSEDLLELWLTAACSVVGVAPLADTASVHNNARLNYIVHPAGAKIRKKEKLNCTYQTVSRSRRRRHRKGRMYDGRRMRSFGVDPCWKVMNFMLIHPKIRLIVHALT